MPDQQQSPDVQKAWELILTRGQEYAGLHRMRRLLKLLPREPRCRICDAPFAGLGGAVMKLFLGKEPAKFNPLFCNDCEVFARKHPGGAVVDVAMLFADIRG